jgi:hypothetical protein|tara:strand:- start:886 stop:1197 length:312 start_codon:yes stop_codon:yes gene_type:complete
MSIKNFAKLDDNNLVLTVLAVDDADCNNGDEATGITFLTNLTGWSKWKLANNENNGDGAAIGGTFDESAEIFKPKQPNENFIWNSDYNIWIGPDDQAAGKLPE